MYVFYTVCNYIDTIQTDCSVLTPVSVKIAKAAGMPIQNVKIRHRSEEWQDMLLNRMLLLIDLWSNHCLYNFLS